MIKRLIFATGNENKMKEIREIMGSLPLEIYSIKEAGIQADIVEDGKTFEENALIKAREVAELVQDQETVVLADDSGLEIDYLDRAPGVYSARFMGENTSYRIKNHALLEKLDGVPEEKRTARFVCVIAAALADGRTLTARGTIEGKIGYEERGENGFGYDPIFYLPDLSRSTAELSPEDKNRISHRGNALRLMEEKLKKLFGGDVE
jgi:XTP/dITP diphosphohydrolase